MLYKPNQPFMLEFVEKRSDVEIQNPVHFLSHHPYPQRVQCILLSTPGSESVAKSLEVLFPYLVEYCGHRLLDDLVLQRGDTQWPFPTIALIDPGPSRRLCSVSLPMNPAVEVLDSFLHTLFILYPRHPIHSWRRLLLQAVVTLQ